MEAFNVFAGKPAAPIIILPKGHGNAKIDKPVPTAPNARARQPARYISSDSSDSSDSFELVEDEIVLRGAARAEVARRGNEPDDLTDIQKIEIFWNLIHQFQWRNASDGVVNARLVKNQISNYSAQHLMIFSEIYRQYYRAMEERLDADDMFARNNIIRPTEKAKIISHAIAMGREQFDTLFADPEFYQFFVENGECQSLDMLLPLDLQH